jgi:thiamine pyrophosphate-dependent acetolactate synthase large subunit-like protein
MERLGASIIIDNLAKQRARYVFSVPEKALNALVRSIVASDRLTEIVANSNLGVGYMAEEYARIWGNLDVCESTGGPGASNLPTAAIGRLSQIRAIPWHRSIWKLVDSIVVGRWIN